MSTLLDALGFLVCLFGGVWLWQHLRALGLSRLAAATVACLLLWVIGALLMLLWQAMVELLALLLHHATPLLPVLSCIALLALLGVVMWLVWNHWRARRFFRS